MCASLANEKFSEKFSEKVLESVESNLANGSQIDSALTKLGCFINEIFLNVQYDTSTNLQIS